MGRERVIARIVAVATTALVTATGVVVAAPASAAVAPAVSSIVLTKAAAAGCATGAHQKAVEGYLKKLGGFGTVTVDGRQSAADCKAIKKFQQRYGILPVAGLAGPTTYGVAKRLAGTKTSSCNAKRKGTTICLDLTKQTIWIMKDGKVYVKPTVTRTGMKNYRTPAGTYKINQRSTKQWSYPYKVWLPYWQHFVGGMGLHETTTYLHDAWRGSHGCVNLLHADARAFYNVGKMGMTVKVFGRRSGT